jgi:diguanylate cyclase (GGDEF)-like protein
MALGGFFRDRLNRSGQGRDGGRSGGGMVDPAERIRLFKEYEDSGLGWFWATDGQGCVTYVTEAVAGILGAPLEEIIGCPLSRVFTLEREEGEDSAERPLGFQLSARNTITDFAVRAATREKEIWWSISAKPCFDHNTEFQGYRGHAKDITATRLKELDASRLALYDSLTGLSNRHRMTQRLKSVLTAYKAAKRSCALLMLDLDRFKHVNDTLGHPAGDELLKQVAQRLERVIGKSGEIGRLGGDEFQVILPDIDDRGKLGELASRIIQMISQPYSLGGSRAVIGTSVGIAIAPYDGIESAELTQSADLALYAAKGGGRGQFRFYSNDLKSSAEERREIEEELRDALAKDQLSLFYQPVVRAEDNTVTSFEALLRWHHPERGAISPGVFIPIAEESNLINTLGEWALRRACDDASKWPRGIKVAVNVSAVQFATTGLPAIVANALASSELEPERLELEITESVFMGDTESAEVTFTALKRLGVKLALDDFGTGYSSMSYLRKSPFDKIKIDQSFVRGCTERDNTNAAIITAIVSLAKALGMETTAEGVEALDELAMMRKLGADMVQGFVYSSAIANEEVMERLESGELKFEPSGPDHFRSERRTVYRRVGVIHEDQRYEAVMRDLSKSGARIEGLLDVPVGTRFVLDLGEGQLVLSIVRRTREAEQGLEFETPLVSDGAGGLCTRHRVSPYALAAAGMPLAALPPGHYSVGMKDITEQLRSTPRFIQTKVAMR